MGKSVEQVKRDEGFVWESEAISSFDTIPIAFDVEGNAFSGTHRIQVQQIMAEQVDFDANPLITHAMIEKLNRDTLKDSKQAYRAYQGTHGNKAVALADIAKLFKGNDEGLCELRDLMRAHRPEHVMLEARMTAFRKYQQSKEVLEELETAPAK